MDQNILEGQEPARSRQGAPVATRDPSVRRPGVATSGGASPTAALSLQELTPVPIGIEPAFEIPASRNGEAWRVVLPDRASGFPWRAGQAVKRAFDLLVAGLGLVALSPVLTLVAVLVKATSRGPVFYRATYVGHRGRPFVGYKFRSMVQNAEDLKSQMGHLNHMHGPAFKIRNDPRVTRLGRFLRKFSIDELPQLWNVVRGDMSLVGPRPPLSEEYREFEPWQRGKLAVRPGITCYWQVQGRSEIHDFAEWARLDLQYIQEWSLWTDLEILVRTIPAVCRGDGAY